MVAGPSPVALADTAAHVALPLLWFAANHILTVRTPMGRKAREHVLHAGGPLLRVKREHLVAAGYGEHQPLSLMDTARNRRIELKLTNR